MESPDWSEMLPELLQTIAQKSIFFYEDYSLSFAAVCKSWKSAAVGATKGRSSNNGPPSRLPSLMLAEKREDENPTEVRELFLLSNNSIRKVQLPEACGKLCLSARGWILTVGDDCAAKLVNPFACDRERVINLPYVHTFPGFLEDTIWDSGVRKLVLVPSSSGDEELSKDNMLVTVLWGCSGKLGFCRPGDDKWTPVLKGWGGQIFDITYHNGQIYSFDCNYCIRACDVYGEDPTTMVKVSRLPVDVYNEWLGGAYILGLDDDAAGKRRLLVVIREGMFDEDEDDECSETYKTKSFQVFAYDLESEKWSKMKDLGSKALFLGYSSSFWIETVGTTGIKGNCIYYTDDVYELFAGSIKGGGRKHKGRRQGHGDLPFVGQKH